MKHRKFFNEIVIKESPWDSEIFNCKCGRLYIPPHTSTAIIVDNLKDARGKGYKFLTSKVVVEDQSLVNSCFQSKGFLADTELILSKAKRANTCSDYQVTSGYSLLLEKKYWNDEILSLATTLTYSRFYRDPRIDKPIALNLWQTSILNNCKGRATYSIICLHGKKPVGIINLFEEKRISDIYLMALLPDYQGMGLGKSMISYYEKQLGDEITTQTVATQVINYPAQKLYLSLGYRATNARHIIHFWL